MEKLEKNQSECHWTYVIVHNHYLPVQAKSITARMSEES